MNRILTCAVLCCALRLGAQEPLRLCGSTTVTYALEPKQAVLESAIDGPIEFSGTGTAAGLLSIARGDADVGMLSTPLEEVVDMVNAKMGGRLSSSQFHSERIGSVRVVFVVNPHNRVRALTAAQVADVLVGKVTNWKQLGGADGRILVVSLANAGPLLTPFLGGVAITPRARLVPNATQIPMLVAQEPLAIGIISTAHPRGQTSVVTTDATIVAPLFLVTKGPPSGRVLRLIHTARTVLPPAS